jgi:hypothetical protein
MNPRSRLQLARVSTRVRPLLPQSLRVRLNRFAPMPAFVVVGTGRCGTTFVAQLLSEAGVPCGHEKVFRRRALTPSFSLAGDCSYLAVPHLASFPGTVIHVVREPLAVIRSLVGTRFFERSPTDGYLAPVAAHMALSGDPVRDAMRYYVLWNRMCERYAHTRPLPIERLDEHLDTLFGLTAPECAAAGAALMRAIPPTVNSRPRAMLSYDDLPAGSTRDEVLEMRDRYGYSPVDSLHVGS